MSTDYDSFSFHGLDLTFKGVRMDPYRIFTVYKVTHPAQQHAIKMLLRAGRAKTQTLVADIDEAIAALERWKEMIYEDKNVAAQKETNASMLGLGSADKAVEKIRGVRLRRRLHRPKSEQGPRETKAQAKLKQSGESTI